MFCALTARGASVIFLHPDGAGVSHWQAARMFWKGPDGELFWDRLPHLAIYRGHMRDNLTSTSNGGATTHAYGVKVPRNAFGSEGEGGKPPVAASGRAESLMQEAKRRGFRVGALNSGSVIEPGTACFLASAANREDHEAIAARVMESGVDVLLSGGEEWFLPEGTTGRHGGVGRRTDGRDLVAEAKKLGYRVVFTAEELAAVPPGTEKLLGLFAPAHTFNDMSEVQRLEKQLPYYRAGAPTLAEMLAKTLELFAGDRFFIVAEEEGTDNFGNHNNARGVLEALRRADDALGVALAYGEKHPDTLLVTAADSSAGNMDVIGLKSEARGRVLEAVRDRNGAPYETAEGGLPFEAAPDQFGQRLPFVVSWGTHKDSSGGIVVRAAGSGAERVRGSMDNTQIYTVMREALFGPGAQP